jgi:hypothetical protein
MPPANFYLRVIGEVYYVDGLGSLLPHTECFQDEIFSRGTLRHIICNHPQVNILIIILHVLWEWVLA